MTNRSWTARGIEFAFDESAYADDAAFLYWDRDHAAEETPRLIKHCDNWGMEVHTGDRRAGTTSKSEMLFVPRPSHLYDDPASFDGTDLSDFELGDGRFIPVVSEFKYLGSVLAHHCGDSADVDVRIKKASQAFGALRDCIFASKSVSPHAKRLVYVTLVLAILLHGAESWCLTEVLFHRLRCFHAQCVRVMCRVNRKHTWLHHISTETLLRRLHLETIDVYVTRRQLRWVGHVARMPFSRLPRRMLSSWVRFRRPTGAPQMTYGRTIAKALRKCDIPFNSWPDLAQDRGRWRSAINSYSSLSSSAPTE